MRMMTLFTYILPTTTYTNTGHLVMYEVMRCKTKKHLNSQKYFDDWVTTKIPCLGENTVTSQKYNGQQPVAILGSLDILGILN